jgi:peptidoglycan-N-acetylglucosamine deacetylase
MGPLAPIPSQNEAPRLQPRRTLQSVRERLPGLGPARNARVRPWVAAFLSCKVCALVLALGHHPAAAWVVLLAPDPWFFVQFILPSQQAFGPAIRSFETERREVWLTIDDGPDPASTPRVLELLKARGAKATFFVIGSQVAKHPDLARRIVADGHSIGNHTQTHPLSSFWSASPSRTASEIEGCIGALLLADAPFERYFRPPVGVRNPFLDAQLTARGMQLVLWNARGFDGGSRSPERALSAVAPCIRPGSILLSHEAGSRAETRLRFMELLLEHLASEGYSCVLPRGDSLRCSG